MMIFKSHFYIYAFLSSIIMLIGCTDNDMPIKDREEEKPPITDEENPSLPPNENTEVALFNILNLTYIIHSGFISGYQNRYGDNLKPPTNVYHRMTA